MDWLREAVTESVSGSHNGTRSGNGEPAAQQLPSHNESVSSTGPICTGIAEIFRDDCGLVDFEMDVRGRCGLNNRFDLVSSPELWGRDHANVASGSSPAFSVSAKTGTNFW